VSEVEFLFTPLAAGGGGAIADRLDRGRVGGDVDVNVDELNVAADVGVNGVKDGLEQVRYRAAAVGVDETSVWTSSA
jgi:hypothetical protein